MLLEQWKVERFLVFQFASLLSILLALAPQKKTHLFNRSVLESLQIFRLFNVRFFAFSHCSCKCWLTAVPTERVDFWDQPNVEATAAWKNCTKSHRPLLWSCWKFLSTCDFKRLQGLQQKNLDGFPEHKKKRYSNTKWIGLIWFLTFETCPRLPANSLQHGQCFIWIWGPHLWFSLIL